MDAEDRDRARRRSYQVKRSQVKAAAKTGSRLAVDRMSEYALWAVLLMELQTSRDVAAGATNVEAYLRLERALGCATELRLRGQQLHFDF